MLAKNDWVVSDHWSAPGSGATAQDAGSPGSDYTPPSPVPDGSSYQVFEIPAESPNHTLTPPPADGRTTVAQPADSLASPFGWHDTNGAAGAESTLTTGNNVDAYTDTDANNVPDAGSRPDGGAGLDFLFPVDYTQAPATYRPAAVSNLFYANSVIHDVSYLYGFTEAATNFQVNNYGRGGTGNDSVQAEAQDGSGTNNANFGTPGEGSRPRMQMFLWTTTTPGRDGDFDNGVIWHEYGHGISNRLHPTVSCLGNSEQMGEGWSDWQSVIMTMKPGESGAVGRGIGTYVLGQPTNGVGIRPARYSTDMSVNNYTYANVGSLAVPHGVGFLWNTMLWEMAWALIDSHGGVIEPNLYNTASTAGNVLAHKLVMAGMDLDPCNPGFVDGRNAILQADQALTGGANACTIWAAFAKRGLGFSASQGSSSSTTDGTPAFDLPASCTFGSATPTAIDACAGTNAAFTVTVGPAFNTPPAAPPVTLATTGAPVAPVFGVNPVPGPLPNNTSMSFDTTGLPTASSTINVTGTTSGGGTQPIGSVALNVFAGAPAGTPTLTAPANGATGQPTSPAFTWSAVAGAATYTLEIATDAAFSNIVHTGSNIVGTSYSGASVNSNTTYYWRARANNPCGTGADSAAFSFTTAPLPGDCPTGTAANILYGTDFESGAGGWTHTGTGDTWALSATNPHSGTQAFFAANPATVSDQRLVSPPVVIPAGNTPISLKFWNWQHMETRTGGCYDGGIVEISTDGGANWTQLGGASLLTDPYDGPVSNCCTNPLANLNAWCGNNPQPYLNSVVDLGSYAGQTVQFRFRLGSDNSVSRPGWYIDDVVVQNCLPVPVELQSFGIE